MKTKKNAVLLVLAFTFISLSFFSQPIIQWQKPLGGIASDDFKVIQQTTDGGYIIGGDSKSNDGDVTGHHGVLSNKDYWIVKLDATGIIQLQKSLGGIEDEELKAIQQTSDGGYIVGGNSKSNDGDVTGHHGTSSDYDYWVVKLDATGNIEWQKSLGGRNFDNLKTIFQTTDGGYIIGGNSNSNDGDVIGNHGMTDDYWIVKLDGSGIIQWQKSLGGTNIEIFSMLQQVADGGYIVGGSSRSSNGDITGHHGLTSYYDYWIVKLDANGTIQWQKSIGGTFNDELWIVEQTPDGGYIVGGNSHSNDGDVTWHYGSGNCSDYWILKLDASGTIQWVKTLGGTSMEKFQIIKQTTDGGYIVGGFSQSNNGNVTGNHGSWDYWVVKVDGSGALQWQKSFGGTQQELLSTVIQTVDGGYIFGGLSMSNDGDVTLNYGSNDFWIVKCDVNGNIQWQKSMGGTHNENSISIKETSNGGYIVAGLTNSNDGEVSGLHGASTDYWIVKLDTPTEVEVITNANNIAIYPNPTTSIINLYFTEYSSSRILEVFNLLGEKNITQQANEMQSKIDLQNYQSGIYFIKVIENNVQVHTQKIIKQ